VLEQRKHTPRPSGTPLERGISHHGFALQILVLILRALGYIEDNPVRKGLVSDPSGWKWSSARLGYNDVPLRVDEVNWELVDAE
jgi:hypothetical protein